MGDFMPRRNFTGEQCCGEKLRLNIPPILLGLFKKFYKKKFNLFCFFLPLKKVFFVVPLTNNYWANKMVKPFFKRYQMK